MDEGARVPKRLKSRINNLAGELLGLELRGSPEEEQERRV